jgi:RNA polymerase sigma factor (sigma-70 family)
MGTHGSAQVIGQSSVVDPVSRERFMIDLDSELIARLRRAAHAQDQPTEQLAASLLARGLEQEALRARIEVVLETLTPREREVALLASRGLTNRQIASTLVISPETVKTHIRHGLAKFGLNSKFELRLLLELGSVG